MKAILKKVKIDSDMLGVDCLITNDTRLMSIDYDKEILCQLKSKNHRSVSQLGLLRKCADLVSENCGEYDKNFSTPDKVLRCAKIDCRLYKKDSIITFTDKDCNTRIHFELLSLSFDVLPHESALTVFDQLFAQLAEYVGLTVEELQAEAKLRMKGRLICEKCGRRAVHRHHKFSQTKINRKKYGKLIDDPRNMQLLCEDCHLNKPVDKYNEKQFCEVMGIDIYKKGEI